MKSVADYTAKDLRDWAALLNVAGRSTMKKNELYAEISERIERCYDLAKAEDDKINAASVTYPRMVNGTILWACCESGIGPVCWHKRDIVEVLPVTTLQDVLDDNGWKRLPRKLKKAYKSLSFIS